MFIHSALYRRTHLASTHPVCRRVLVLSDKSFENSPALPTPPSYFPPVHRSTARWVCVQGCGACCRLAPVERPGLEEWLSTDELEQYHSMVLPDGWCRHFDQDARTCTIFERRPRFCRAEPAVFRDLYGVGEEDFDEFARECCMEQIVDVYGGVLSDEMIRFAQAIVRRDPSLRPEIENMLQQLAQEAVDEEER
ncbi:hypothetical protein CDCA_CDCA07G2067 [Cyanidium caldarium]|uniref:YkgJ family cysteine cluster protein n=1 Tax=Cyanidium caldarium TaxID=2771 RepID=A0AAV9IUN1_CYACA|nr:hypothetical protein CDCA_CDCA07G2067 [Cyanidium caldarium]